MFASGTVAILTLALAAESLSKPIVDNSTAGYAFYLDSSCAATPDLVVAYEGPGGCAASSCDPAEMRNDAASYYAKNCGGSDRYDGVQILFGQFNYEVVEWYYGVGCAYLVETNHLPESGGCELRSSSGDLSLAASVFANGSAVLSASGGGSNDGHDHYLAVPFAMTSANTTSPEPSNGYYMFHTKDSLSILDGALSWPGENDVDTGMAPSDSSSSGRNGGEGASSTGAIVGIVVACLVVVLFIPVLAIRRRRAKKHGEAHAKPSKGGGPTIWYGGFGSRGLGGWWDDDKAIVGADRSHEVFVYESISRDDNTDVYGGSVDEQHMNVEMPLTETEQSLEQANEFPSEIEPGATSEDRQLEVEQRAMAEAEAEDSELYGGSGVHGLVGSSDDAETTVGVNISSEELLVEQPSSYGGHEERESEAFDALLVVAETPLVETRQNVEHVDEFPVEVTPALPPEHPQVRTEPSSSTSIVAEDSNSFGGSGVHRFGVSRDDGEDVAGADIPQEALAYRSIGRDNTTVGYHGSLEERAVAATMPSVAKTRPTFKRINELPGGVMVKATSKYPRVKAEQGTFTSAMTEGSYLFGGSGIHSLGGLWYENNTFAGIGILREEVRLHDLIRRGSWRAVYYGSSSGQLVAVKVLLLGNQQSVEDAAAFRDEVKLLATLKHPQLVQIVGLAWCSLTAFFGVSEHVEGSDLRALLSSFAIRDYPQGFDRIKTTIALHVAQALTYLHSLKSPRLQHDVKSKNVLLTASLKAKLTGFGIAQGYMARGMIGDMGALLWTAPELLICEQGDEKTDVFAFGVMLSELDLHSLPYSNAKESDTGRRMSDMALLQRVALGELHVELSASVPEPIVALGLACVSVDPRERPTAAEVATRIRREAGVAASIMSSLRNVVKRREHKERGQLRERRKLGLLEKHKDYVKRARDYNKKQARLQKMQLTASLRNPDEFYFRMASTRTEEGVHVSENNHHDGKKLTAEALRALKTQDLAYLHVKRAVDLRKAEKLNRGLHFVDAPKGNQHTLFVDNGAEVDAFDVAEHFDTAPELADRAFNRIRKADLQTLKLSDQTTDVKQRHKMQTQRDAVYRELGDRLDRAQKLGRMSARLDLERKVQAKGKKMKVKGPENGLPAVYRWKQERQK
ncbi:hypothetical protein BBJ28_00020294 [Nothophytophthora sp. Chile5]|nr:hypothetical protein BBJ28_00020294 [Nothophytophthora sp. Chile5]